MLGHTTRKVWEEKGRSIEEMKGANGLYLILKDETNSHQLERFLIAIS